MVGLRQRLDPRRKNNGKWVYKTLWEIWLSRGVAHSWVDESRSRKAISVVCDEVWEAVENFRRVKMRRSQNQRREIMMVSGDHPWARECSQKRPPSVGEWTPFPSHLEETEKGWCRGQHFVYFYDEKWGRSYLIVSSLSEKLNGIQFFSKNQKKNTQLKEKKKKVFEIV